jgi:hypothetical protein
MVGFNRSNFEWLQKPSASDPLQTRVGMVVLPGSSAAKTKKCRLKA